MGENNPSVKTGSNVIRSSKNSRNSKGSGCIRFSVMAYIWNRIRPYTLAPLVLNSLLFIGVIETLPVATQCIGSIAVFRFVIMIELAGLRQ
ncbi:hypothetical protein N431DRAFT_1579 [Stipitochalara longipes BDJ]|nr:hypothetical protein N431DRAFT_1579 [Stipitochalara longipes BDJ]